MKQFKDVLSEGKVSDYESFPPEIKKSLKAIGYKGKSVFTTEYLKSDKIYEVKDKSGILLSPLVKVLAKDKYFVGLRIEKAALVISFTKL